MEQGYLLAQAELTQMLRQWEPILPRSTLPTTRRACRGSTAGGLAVTLDRATSTPLAGSASGERARLIGP